MGGEGDVVLGPRAPTAPRNAPKGGASHVAVYCACLHPRRAPRSATETCERPVEAREPGAGCARPIARSGANARSTCWRPRTGARAVEESLVRLDEGMF